MKVLIIGGMIAAAALCGVCTYTFLRREKTDPPEKNEKDLNQAKANITLHNEYTQEGMIEAIVSLVSDRAQRGYVSTDRCQPLVFDGKEYKIGKIAQLLTPESKHALLRDYGISVTFPTRTDKGNNTMLLRW